MVSVSVSKKNGIEKSIGIGFEKILVSEKVSVLVSKNFCIEKSIGIGIGKELVSKKVSVSVSKKNWYRKKFRILFRSDFRFHHTLLNGSLQRKSINFGRSACCCRWWVVGWGACTGTWESLAVKTGRRPLLLGESYNWCRAMTR